MDISQGFRGLPNAFLACSEALWHNLTVFVWFGGSCRPCSSSLASREPVGYSRKSSESHPLLIIWSEECSSSPKANSTCASCPAPQQVSQRVRVPPLLLPVSSTSASPFCLLSLKTNKKSNSSPSHHIYFSLSFFP